MNVYLIKTPEYDADDFREVGDLLSSFDGPLNFISSSYEFKKQEFYFLQYQLYPVHPFEYPTNETAIKFDPERQYPLSWRELFSLCEFYRELFKIEEDSFVVLLTKRKNSLNWFSACDKTNNIFVHTAEWEYYTRVNSKYPIAYQVIENILQSLMKINIHQLPNPYIHEPLRGCMNDLCINKKEIILKLQTANICSDCVKKMRDEKFSPNILRQAKSIFNGIREEFIFQEEEQSNEPISLIVDHNGKILLPEFELEITLTPLFKTLYLFNLSKPEGVSVSELSDFKSDLLSIYKKLRPNVAHEDAEIRINNLSDGFGSGFNPTRSHINRTIKGLLQEPLSDYYTISGTAGNPYKIKIPRDLVDIRY